MGAALACVLLVGVGFGFVLGRWRIDRDGGLVQTGEIRPLAQDAEVEIRYPRPYASLPCIRVEEPIRRLPAVLPAA
jgi:hypothetical protein